MKKSSPFDNGTGNLSMGSTPALEGRSLGPYSDLSFLGAGGMGEVYRARDPKLGRKVAIKVLRRDVTGDPELAARFEREARVLASLNHPHIGIIYEFGQAPEAQYLVLELVAGDTLAERLQRGPLRIKEALELLRQVADALVAAHEQGIVHRDLKPGNIKVTPEGTVKVLDFGLAKVLWAEPPSSGGAETATLSQADTRAGTLLGTGPYMSPEQIRGFPVDRRSDIWAFGCTLFEALAGKRAFEGATFADLCTAIASKEPEWGMLPQHTPQCIHRLLRRCLEKDSNRRLRSMEHARIELEEALAETGPATPTAAPRRLSWLTALPWVIALALSIYVIWAPKPPPPTPGVVGRFSITSPRPLLAGIGPFEPDLAIAPDGSQIAYVALENNRRQLFLRALDELDSKSIPGTEGASNPVFSPDGQWLAFVSARKLKKIALSGGEPVSLCEVAGDLNGVSWGDNDRIIFAGLWERDLKALPASGGTLQTVTAPGEGTLHFWPHLLPGGKSVLFSEYPAGSIVIQSLETGRRKVLAENGSCPLYARSGHLLFMRGGTLMAAAFDPVRWELTGPVVPVIERVAYDPFWGNAEYALSRSGSLVYRPPWLPVHSLVSRSAGSEEQLLAPPGRAFYNPRLSPEGRRLAMTVEDDRGHDVWVLDLGSGLFTRITFDAAVEFTPVWSRDGSRLIYSVMLSGSATEIHWKAADGSQVSERLFESKHAVFPSTVTPDDELIYVQEGRAGGWDIMTVSLKNKAEPRRLLGETFHENQPVLSPDGHWLAYASNETGRFEVFARSYPDLKRKWQVSQDGAVEPRWARSGLGLFYRSGRKYYAVSVSTEPRFIAGSPRLLFEGDYETGLPAFTSYDVSADDRSLILVRGKQERPTEIRVILNWFEELRARAKPGKNQEFMQE